MDLLRILDESIQTNGATTSMTSNGDMFDLLNHGDHQSKASPNPLEDLLFSTSTQKSSSNNGNFQLSRSRFSRFTLAIPPMTVIDKNGLRVLFNFERHDTTLTIQLRATNSTHSPITDFVFKAAVPKVRHPHSSTAIP